MPEGEAHLVTHCAACSHLLISGWSVLWYSTCRQVVQATIVQVHRLFNTAPFRLYCVKPALLCLSLKHHHMLHWTACEVMCCDDGGGMVYLALCVCSGGLRASAGAPLETA